MEPRYHAWIVGAIIAIPFIYRYPEEFGPWMFIYGGAVLGFGAFLDSVYGNSKKMKSEFEKKDKKSTKSR